jgi:hypothetical protein
MFTSFGLGEIMVVLMNVLLLTIPLIVLWLLFKTFRKISRQNEQIGQEVKQLKEEIQSIKEKGMDRSPK